MNNKQIINAILISMLIVVIARKFHIPRADSVPNQIVYIKR